MKDPEYVAAFATAREEAADRLEREAIRRAVDGAEKPVYQAGKLVGTIREYSDTLLIFTLKGLRPEKYRERYDQRVTADVTRHESNSELDAEIRQLVDQLRGQGS